MEKESYPYSILQCPDGDLMLLMPACGDSPQGAVLIYDGGDMAILLRGGARTIRLRNIGPEARKPLTQLQYLFVAESDGETIIRDYYATVRIVRDLKRLMEPPEY